MNELSIFIDESGDFGEYDHHSPYYIIGMVFHDQSTDIYSDIKKLETELSYIKLPNQYIHVGPIIRRIFRLSYQHKSDIVYSLLRKPRRHGQPPLYQIRKLMMRDKKPSSPDRSFIR